jgi:hypothetical protein
MIIHEKTFFLGEKKEGRLFKSRSQGGSSDRVSSRNK